MQLVSTTKGVCFWSFFHLSRINENPDYMKGATDSIILILI